jgi:hypothetical protein
MKICFADSQSRSETKSRILPQGRSRPSAAAIAWRSIGTDVPPVPPRPRGIRVAKQTSGVRADGSADGVALYDQARLQGGFMLPKAKGAAAIAAVASKYQHRSLSDASVSLRKHEIV